MPTACQTPQVKPKSTQINLRSQECGIRDLNLPAVPSIIFRYNENPEIRDLVRDFLHEFVEQNRNNLFKNRGRCGDSCRLDDVLVREQDILRIQQHLGISESEFRKRYLLPSPTWNPGDGLMKLENWACPFLSVDTHQSPGRAHTTHCTIYEVRPQNCRDFVSDKSFCVKDLGLLIERITQILMAEDSTRVVFSDTEWVDMPTPSHWFVQLSTKLWSQEPTQPQPQKHERISAKVGEHLDCMLNSFEDANLTDAYRNDCKRLRRLVHELAKMQHFSQNNESMEQLWFKLHRLELLVSNEGAFPAVAAAPREEEEESGLDWLLVQENGLVVRPAGQTKLVSLPFLQVPSLREAIAHLLQKVLERPEALVQDAVREDDPPCYMCGECCRCLVVEIKPSDIDRLCQLLPVTPTKFVELYTEPGQFSWNKKARILNKVEAPIYSKNLKSLRLLQDEGPHSGSTTSNQCVFLERRDDGFFYCQVHSHKPDVCRNYSATNRLCKDANQRENWGRQAQSLTYVAADFRLLSLQTRSRLAQNRPPLTFPREAWQEVDSSLRDLESLAAQELRKHHR